MDTSGKAAAVDSFQPVCREHTVEEWEDQRQLIKQLYRDEDKSLKELVSIMEAQYAFFATQVNISAEGICQGLTKFQRTAI